MACIGKNSSASCGSSLHAELDSPLGWAWASLVDASWPACVVRPFPGLVDRAHAARPFMSPLEADAPRAMAGLDLGGWLRGQILGPGVRIAIAIIVASLSVAGFLSGRGAETGRAPSLSAFVALSAATPVSQAVHQTRRPPVLHHHRHRHGHHRHRPRPAQPRLWRAAARSANPPTLSSKVLQPPTFLPDDIVLSLPPAAPLGDLVEVGPRHPTSLNQTPWATPPATQVLEVAEAGRGASAAIPRSLDGGLRPVLNWRSPPADFLKMQSRAQAGK